MESPLEGLEGSAPNIARIYDYILGGKNNTETDRVSAEQILRLLPEIGAAVIENRKFLRTAVRYLTQEAGIDQFLDIGVGLPTQGPVHEVAAEIIPAAKVAYVDYDPAVVSHASALLTDLDRAIAVLGDMRRPGELLADPGIRSHLDFGRPVFPRTKQDTERILDGFEVIDADEVERHALLPDRDIAPPIGDPGWRLVARKS